MDSNGFPAKGNYIPRRVKILPVGDTVPLRLCPLNLLYPRPATFISTSVCQLSGSNWLGLRYSPSSELGD